jgi:regulator of sirC expression with transglutaminase-like and TPR domain
VSEAAAIARLLADPDPGIASSLRRQLLAREDEPPGLREAVEALPDPVERARAREARFEIGCERAADRLIRRGRSGHELDLELGAFEIARMEDPDADVVTAGKTLDALAERARPKVAAACNPRARLEALAWFLGQEEGFTGDRNEEEVPRCSSLPSVIERRRGLPISLSTVYLLVGRRLGLELFGVAAPLHFLVGGPIDGGMLYLDAFDRGRTLEAEDAAALLRGLGVVFRLEHLAPAATRPIVARMARNLVAFYARRPRGESRARRYARVAMALEDSL